MSRQRYTLRLLQALTTFAGLNVFTFEQPEGHFRRRRQLYKWLRLLHLLLLLVMSPFVVTLLMFSLEHMYSLITTLSLQGGEALLIINEVVFHVTVTTRFCLSIYIAYLLVWRSVQLEQLLNLFARVYAAYVRLFGPQLCLRWCIFATLCCSSIVAYAFVFCQSIWSRASAKALALLVLLSLQSVLLTLVCNFGLVLLHAMLHGAERHMQPLSARLERHPPCDILDFCNALMRLRVDFGAFASFVFISELLLNLTWSTMYMHYYYSRHNNWLCCLLFLVYPYYFMNISHDISEVPLSLGIELLELDIGIIVVGASEDDFLKYFCWHELVTATTLLSPFDVLDLRKDYLLEFWSMVFVNCMFLNSILITLIFDLYSD